jgi:hypothetical protein
VRVDKARFTRTVVPGDQLKLEVMQKRLIRRMGLYECRALVGDQEVASAEILCAAPEAEAHDPPHGPHRSAAQASARMCRSARFRVIGAGVEIGDDCDIGSHVVIDGPTRIGPRNRFYLVLRSIGGDPQDKKFRGESGVASRSAPTT